MTTSTPLFLCFCLLFLSLISVVENQPQFATTTAVVGTSVNGTIFYQTSDFIKLGNILNPVTINAEVTSSSAINLCYNPYQGDNYKISGVVSNNNMVGCPKGAFAQINPTSTPSTSTLKLSQRLRTQNKASKLMEAVVNDNYTTAELYLVPSSFGGFVVSPTSNGTTTFSIEISYFYCAQANQIPLDNATCVTENTISALPSSFPLNLSANSTAYYSFVISPFSSSNNNGLNITLGSTSTSTVYIQQGYFPNPSGNWYLTSVTAGQQLILYTPSYFAVGQKYYIAVVNSANSEDTSTLSLEFTTCTDSNTFGYNCQVNSQTEGAAINQITNLPALLTLDYNAQTNATNNGTAWVFSDYSSSDYAGQFLYFSVDTSTLSDTFEALRVSVGANDHKDSAPFLYAKLNGYPSDLSYDYATDSSSVASQLVLPITPTDQWYLAVQLPADFSIWVGGNCANNCSNMTFGYCSCSDPNGGLSYCNDLIGTANYSVQNLYIFPTNIGDSAGLCECTNDLFGGFECVDVLSYVPVAVVFAITILTAIALVILIAVPSYFYLRHKKRIAYEQL